MKIFRAKYVVVLHLGGAIPVLLPPGISPAAHDATGRIGHPIAEGDCELHTLGEGALGFVVSGPKCRDRQDAQLLDQYFIEGGVE